MRYLLVLLMVCGCATAGPDMSDVEASGHAEAKAYAEALHVRMDRGEISEPEARALYQQKVNDLTDRYERIFRERTAAQRSARPQTTTCRDDGLGRVRCTTR